MEDNLEMAAERFDTNLKDAWDRVAPLRRVEVNARRSVRPSEALRKLRLERDKSSKEGDKTWPCKGQFSLVQLYYIVLLINSLNCYLVSLVAARLTKAAARFTTAAAILSYWQLSYRLTGLVTTIVRNWGFRGVSDFRVDKG
jgi:uncharacterized membrane protein